ncbi:MAG: hypothetical protein AAFO29_22915, partial [Actinomycetota bacterium]
EGQVGHAGRGIRRFWVEAMGPFLTVRPGLQKVETVWRLLGRLHVVAAADQGAGDGVPDPVLVLTSNRPRPGSPADKVLRSVGPNALFDVIELYDPAALERLRRYASGAQTSPLPGFWSEADVERWSS